MERKKTTSKRPPTPPPQEDDEEVVAEDDEQTYDYDDPDLRSTLSGTKKPVLERKEKKEEGNFSSELPPKSTRGRKPYLPEGDPLVDSREEQRRDTTRRSYWRNHEQVLAKQRISYLSKRFCNDKGELDLAKVKAELAKLDRLITNHTAARERIKLHFAEYLVDGK